MAAKGAEGAFTEAVPTALAHSLSEWAETLLGLKSESFLAHVAIEVTAALIVAGIVAFLGFLVSRTLWRAIRRRWRAATIRRTSGNSFVIVRCPIINDTGEAIGNEIGTRLETAFRVFAGWHEQRPFHIMEFPLLLPNGDGTTTHDQATKVAKHWLDRTGGDILIWGKRVKNDAIGIIRLVGKDLKTGVIEVRRIDFDNRAYEFDAALANAIAFEAARLTQVGLSEPETVSLDELRILASKLKKLADADAPALSDNWRRRLDAEYWRLSSEIVRQTSSSEERRSLEAEARSKLSDVRSIYEPIRFAEAALNVAIVIRKKNWSDPDPGQLHDARSLLDQAATIFEQHQEPTKAAEAALELLQIRRQELLFVADTDAECDKDYSLMIANATRLVKGTNDEAQYQRLAAIAFCYPAAESLAELYSFDNNDPSKGIEFVERVAKYLDNGELLDVARRLSNLFSEWGDKFGDLKFFDADMTMGRAILESRSSWSSDEQLFLKSSIAYQAAVAYQRAGSSSAAAKSYADSVHTFLKEFDGSINWLDKSKKSLVVLRTLSNSGVVLKGAEDDSRDSCQRAVYALRTCAGPDGDRFPRLQRHAKESLVAVLNNIAVEFNSKDAADEALRIALNIAENRAGRRCYLHYIRGFAAWQVARLTQDLSERNNRGRQARIMAQRALKYAEGDQVMTSQIHVLLRTIERTFPALAPDLDAASTSQLS